MEEKPPPLITTDVKWRGRIQKDGVRMGFEQGMQSWKVGIAHGCTDERLSRGRNSCLMFFLHNKNDNVVVREDCLFHVHTYTEYKLMFNDNNYTKCDNLIIAPCAPMAAQGNSVRVHVRSSWSCQPSRIHARARVSANLSVLQDIELHQVALFRARQTGPLHL